MPKALGAAEEKVIVYALRHSRGRYLADRAAQLSGVPRSTLYDWRRESIYVPDFDADSPIAWSYRDLVYVRLLAWLRQLGMPRPSASERVQFVKSQIAAGTEIRTIGSNGRTLVLDDDGMTQLGQNLLPFDDIFGLLQTFDVVEPIDELRRRGRNDVWAPNLVTPSDHTFISPWVLAGDPCVLRTRIPTSAIHALREERGLSGAEIVELYPGLTREAVEDAFTLERRLRGAA
ncbi:MAG: DUF433 domain-containing protein [Acidimicrobiales bacterium]